MKTKREYKQKKREIVENGALEVGYRNKVFEEITMEQVLIALEETDLDKDSLTNAHILLTEVVKYINYQDFKKIAHYFFNYNRK